MIHSDSAAMYVNLRANPPTSHLTQIAVNPPYEHQWVNHTRNFVDPITSYTSKQFIHFNF